MARRFAPPNAINPLTIPLRPGRLPPAQALRIPLDADPNQLPGALVADQSRGGAAQSSVAACPVRFCHHWTATSQYTGLISSAYTRRPNSWPATIWLPLPANGS